MGSKLRLALFSTAILFCFPSFASPSPGEWLLKADKKDAARTTRRGCTSKVLNPHLGADIYLIRCASTPQRGTIEPNATWNLLEARAAVAHEPQDPMNSDQWALDRLNVRSFWQSSSVGDARVKVAIIDSGVDYRHQDLQPNIALNTSEVPNNGADDDGNGYVDDYFGWDSFAGNGDPMDRFDHGTHVAGVIGAGTDNGIGISGLNWQVSIIPVKFIGPNGGGSTAAAIEAFDYAVARGAKIINVSWAGPNPSPLLEEVLKRCREKGILIIAAAGNESADNDKVPSYPASYGLSLDNMVSVAAIDLRGDLAGFSNWGAQSVQIAAPGQSILSTISGHKYGFKDGTSMAAPHIVGAAALVWAAHPEWDYVKVREFLLNHCAPSPSLAGKVACQGYFQF